MRQLLFSILILLVGCTSLNGRELHRDKYLLSLMDNLQIYRGLLIACKQEKCSERITNIIYTGYVQNLSDFAAAYDPKVDQVFVINVCSPIPQEIKGDINILNLIKEIRVGLECDKY